MTKLSGNTYPVKDQLRALGGKWDPTSKAWLVPDDKIDEARSMVAAGTAGGSKPATRRRFVRCADCGSRPGVIDCADSSGLRGLCCNSCARMSRWERSFA